MYEAIQTIAYQGVEGSNSHECATQIAPQAKSVGHLSFEDTLNVVEQHECDVALVPIENSIGGRVAEIHLLLNHMSLHIIGEWFHTIRHVLLGTPHTDLKQIHSVRSHPQALLQCSRFIDSMGWRAIHDFDTAYAARILAEKPDDSCAVISTKMAAKIYNLKILRQDIANNNNNITRFITLTAQKPETVNFRHPLSSIIVQVRSVPAALYKILGGLATSGINIVKLESYVNADNFSVASFYIEIEGNIYDENYEHALDEIKYFSEWVKVLGVYESHPFRHSS